MNKEQAEIYVTKSLNMPKTLARGSQYKFLLLNVICFGIAVALFRELEFIIANVFIVGLNIFFTFLLAKKKPQFLKVTMLICMQLIIFCISLNFIVFGLEKLTDTFVLWEFLVSIIVQIISFVPSFFLVKNHAEKFVADASISKNEVIAGAVAGFTYALALVLCRIFSPTLSAVTIIISVLINIMVCLISVGIVAAIYRAYLIKKYKLAINLVSNERQH